MKRIVDDLWRTAAHILLALTLAFLIGPLIVAISMSLDARGYLAPFPPKSLSLRWYAAFFANDVFIVGLRNSLILGFFATLISAVVGTLAALALVNHEFRGRTLLSALFLSPLMIPAVVVGL